jgi:hypothetical protein
MERDSDIRFSAETELRRRGEMEPAKVIPAHPTLF